MPTLKRSLVLVTLCAGSLLATSSGSADLIKAPEAAADAGAAAPEKVGKHVGRRNFAAPAAADAGAAPSPPAAPTTPAAAAPTEPAGAKTAKPPAKPAAKPAKP